MDRYFVLFLLVLLFALGCSKTYYPEGKVSDRFTVSKEGIIIDSTINLEWLPDPGKNMTRKAAINYAKNLVFAGHDDWRLPTQSELMSLQDNSQDTVYKIHPVFRLGGCCVWTSEHSGQIMWSFGLYPFEDSWPHRALIGRLRVLVVRSR